MAEIAEPDPTYDQAEQADRIAAVVVRIKAPSGNRDNDHWQATCGECPWKGALYSNRTVEGRTLADRDAAEHRCPTGSGVTR